MENQTINPKNFKEGDKLIIPTEATFLLQVQDDLFQVIINGISSYIRKDQIIEHIPLNPPPKEKTVDEILLEEIKGLRKELQEQNSQLQVLEEFLDTLKSIKKS